MDGVKNEGERCGGCSWPVQSGFETFRGKQKTRCQGGERVSRVRTETRCDFTVARSLKVVGW